MNQIVLSSQRLDANKVLQTGTLDLFELLKKNNGLEIINLDASNPKKSLTLEWKEVKTPATSQSFRDLAGKKLAEYKFQYLGQFKYNKQVIETTTETFVSDFPEQNIHSSKIKSTGWVNCTWLVDFLMNADKIQESTLRQERLIWREENDSFVLALSSQATDMRSAEQEKFVFCSKFESLSWEHKILFGA